MAIFLVGRDINDWVGALDVGHLMLIRHTNGSFFGSNDLIIRGGPDDQTGDISIQSNISFADSLDNPTVWGQTGNFSTFHEPLLITFASPNYDNVAWDIMNQIADQIQANAIEYI